MPVKIDRIGIISEMLINSNNVVNKTVKNKIKLFFKSDLSRGNNIL